MNDGEVCSKCGAFGDLPHTWQEGDCLLPHRRHAPARIGFCCTWCVDRHKAWLAEIVELYATLELVLEPGSVGHDLSEYQKPRKRPASPSPVRLDAWAMLYDRDRLYRTGAPSDLPDVPAVTAVHAEALHEAMYGVEHTYGTLTAAAGFLAANAETAAGQPWIDEYDADLGWLRKALRHAHGTPNPKPVGHCPSLDGNGDVCGGPLWQNGNGSMAVSCGKCERTYEEQFLRHLGGMIEAS